MKQNQENQMEGYKRPITSSNRKARRGQLLALLEAQIPLKELMNGVRHDIEAIAADFGMTIIQAIMEQEIRSLAGPWGKQKIHRHGSQPGYVIYAGRKVTLARPRARHPDQQEVQLQSYKAFQEDGKMQQAVARQLARQCSTRNYEGAIDECIQGYGIKKSTVSRQWKAATIEQLTQLMNRPVPQDLLVLMIDGKFFGDDCIVTAIAIDAQGKKHVLGLWHGATENATVVKGLLEELVSRGLDCERKMLVVMDGSKALRKAVTLIFGPNAIVQRCRVHKQRNIVDQLPKEKRRQAIWRLRAAWAKKDAAEAQRDLERLARWLEGFSPMAAQSLREGLAETLTLQRLGVTGILGRTLSSTNLIEGCFAQVASWTKRVKHWDGPTMILRWTAGGLLWAEKQFNRLHGCGQLTELEKVLRETESISTLAAA
jgi:transposase-like protein